MDTSINFHSIIDVKAQRRGQAAWLRVEAENGDYIAMHMPSHVSEHIAEAFNRAMQAVARPGGGYTYNDANDGIWHISVDAAMGKVWLGQNDEVTGDGDPSWMFADGKSLIDVMDAIDAIIEEHSCPECGLLVGERKLNDCTDGKVRCWDCDEAWQLKGAAMHEAAEDDKAHAQMDMVRGL